MRKLNAYIREVEFEGYVINTKMDNTKFLKRVVESIKDSGEDKDYLFFCKEGVSDKVSKLIKESDEVDEFNLTPIEKDIGLDHIFNTSFEIDGITFYLIERWDARDNVVMPLNTIDPRQCIILKESK